ncbi:hypothetical protein [Rhodopila sp.]|uniref:hypothetical protein n=1 Tax=Rhodopila sp. TaxID=2480087 RepID=UPI003D144B38
MHSTAELRKEIAELRAEIEALKQASAPNPELAAAAAAEEAGTLERRRHAEAEAAGRRKHDIWMAAHRKATAAKEAAAIAALYLDAEGNALPPGQYRDPSGFIREISSGKRIETVERAKAETEQVMRQQAVEHRSYLKRIGLPVRETTTLPTPTSTGDLP